MAQPGKVQIHSAGETGLILIRDGALLPLNLSLKCTPFTRGWRVIQDLDSHAFGLKMKEKNWSFVRVGPQRKVRVLGLATQGTLRRGVDRILDDLKGRRFNSRFPSWSSGASGGSLIGVFPRTCAMSKTMLRPKAPATHAHQRSKRGSKTRRSDRLDKIR